MLNQLNDNQIAGNIDSRIKKVITEREKAVDMKEATTSVKTTSAEQREKENI